MESNNKSVLQSTMESGVVFGVVLVLMNIGTNLFSIKAFTLSGLFLVFLVTVLVHFFFIFYYTKHYREKELEGFISFNQAFIYGILLLFFSGIILSFYLFILHKFIEPDLARKNIEDTKELFIKIFQGYGLSEDAIDSYIKKIDANGIPTPAQIALNNVFSSLLFGLILSLISAAILKKTANPFSSEKKNNEF